MTALQDQVLQVSLSSSVRELFCKGLSRSRIISSALALDIVDFSIFFPCRISLVPHSGSPSHHIPPCGKLCRLPSAVGRLPSAVGRRPSAVGRRPPAAAAAA